MISHLRVIFPFENWLGIWIVAAAGIGILFAKFLIQSFRSVTIPPGIPRVRDEARIKFSVKTRWAYMTNCRDLYHEAYERYSKKGLTCVLPSMGFKDEIHIPVQSLHWAATQPDSVLSAVEGFREIDKGDWNSGSADYIQNPWQAHVVKRDVNRSLEILMKSMNEELGFAIDQRIGMNTEAWREIDIYETMRWIVAQASSRFTVGFPMCRNQNYLRSSLDFADLFIMNVGLLAYTPTWLKPIVGPIITLPNRYRKWQVKNAIRKTYEERVGHLRNPSLNQGYKEPHDSLQMMLQYAMENFPSDLTLEHISARLCLANLASFHQTAVAISNIILNIAASDSEYNTVSVLREEIHSVLASQSGNWTKSGVAKMIRTDSVLRESMRLHAFGNRAMIRKVIDPNGLMTEDGHLLPNGSTLSILSHPIHHDGDVFVNPEKFDPFRFSRIREADLCGVKTEDDKGDSSNLSFVSTGPTYLPFGHGKHACPGRNLVDFEMKMLLRYMVENYDIELAPEYNGVRPEGVWITEAVMPPTGAKVRVRRKRKDMK